MTLDLIKHPNRSLAFARPELTTQWDYKKNFPFTPHQIPAFSPKKYWWLCKNNHSWLASPNQRKNNICPKCKQPWYVRLPKVANQWHPSLNKNTSIKEALTQNKYWWLCENNHSWEALLSNRINTAILAKCSVCHGQSIITGVTDLKTLYPQVSEKWDYKKNSTGPEFYTPFSNKKVWWLCSVGHSYEDTINHQVAGRNCKYCTNRVILSGFNDLETRYPSIAREWDTSKNSLLPSQVFPGISKEYWWICPEGHSYTKSPNKRTSRSEGCKICSQKSSTSLTELALFETTKGLLNEAVNGLRLPSLYLNNRNTPVDIFGFYLGKSIVIEYDSYYYHNAPNQQIVDTNKTLGLLEAGHIVIRVREKPLSFLDLVDDRFIQISFRKADNLTQLVQKMRVELEQYR